MFWQTHLAVDDIEEIVPDFQAASSESIDGIVAVKEEGSLA